MHFINVIACTLSEHLPVNLICLSEAAMSSEY